jgi:pimeloyl-ACP methyl ester carboxylesterase
MLKIDCLRRPLVLLLAALLFSGAGANMARANDDTGECVILLHGLFRTHLALKPMEWYLQSEGYTTVNQSYPSLLYPIEELAEMAVGRALQHCHGLGRHRIHFVTHSLGGILVRQYAAVHPIQGIGRVVMLGPPNQGSQVADYYSSLEIMGIAEPVALAQLGTGEASIPQRLGPVEFELGVIAGNFRSSTVLPGFPDEASDGTVSVSEAFVPGMIDFLQMPVSHTFMIINPEVMRQVVHFLRSGAFDRD